MKYYELKIYTDKPGLELISNLLVENEIEGAIINDPQDFADIMAKKDELDWDYVDEEQMRPKSMRPSITVYFEDSYKMKRRMGFFREALVDLQNRALKGEFGPDIELGRITVETRIVNDVDWKDK